MTADDPNIPLRQKTAKIMQECLESLGWSNAYLADRLSVQERTIQRWLNGINTIPPNIIPWLLDYKAYDDSHSLPQGWLDLPS